MRWWQCACSHVKWWLGLLATKLAAQRAGVVQWQNVSFRWRDYAHGAKQRAMPPGAVEFLRRFFLHVLPRGFVRIRHYYGLLSNRFRKQLLPLARILLAAQSREPLPLPLPRLPSRDLWHCPRCNAPMRVVERFTTAPPYFACFDSS